MAGRHFIYAALPAIHLGLRYGMTAESIAAVLRTTAPPAMRGDIRTAGGIRFIVDCYNANPSSMRSALDVLGKVGRGGPLAAIVGDMLELGRYSRRLHNDLGRRLARAGVSRILAVGEFAGEVARGARSAGMNGSSITTAADSRDAATLALRVLRDGDTVLVKGSRGVHLETVINNYGITA
jgi:UDP-N-acetylmuramoyl-tripeptide--D-alanyl-D-alanine ligase